MAPASTPRCQRCLGLGHVPARHPLADPEFVATIPCPECRADEALAAIKRGCRR